MSWLDDTRERLDKLQEYASAYFETIYKTIFPFWTLPEIPSGANILTGGFAALLIWIARGQMSQSVDAQTVGGVLVITFFFILLICGILIAFDAGPAPATPEGSGSRRIDQLRKLVSVVCVIITLGAGFIVLDWLFPWINVLFQLADSLGWGIDAANRLIATGAALFGSTVIFANTVGRLGVGAYRNTRVWSWSLAIFVIVAVGINLVMAPLASGW